MSGAAHMFPKREYQSRGGARRGGDRPEEAVVLLKAPLVLDEQSVEILKENAVKDGALGMPGTRYMPVMAGKRPQEAVQDSG